MNPRPLRPVHDHARRCTRAVALLAALVIAGAGHAADNRNVQLRDVPLRAAPGPFAETIARVAYGTTVQVLERRDGWARVQGSDLASSGWLRTSALTEREIELQAGAEDAQVEASEDELATAAKGFNERVEKKYKQDEGLDYTWVDRIEGFTVADERRESFLEQGNLRVP